jgi:hypothetical protein
MRSRTLFASTAAGATMALGALIPAAQAASSSYHDPAGAVYVVASKVTPVHAVTPTKKSHHTITVGLGAGSRTLAPATLPARPVQQPRPSEFCEYYAYMC